MPFAEMICQNTSVRKNPNEDQKQSKTLSLSYEEMSKSVWKMEAFSSKWKGKDKPN